MSDPQSLPLILRYSTTAGSVPGKAEFQLNSFVINWADHLLYWLDPDGVTVQSMPIMPGQIAPVAAIASAATTDIGARAADTLSITGTVAITSLGTSPNRLKRVVFASSLVLTYDSAKLILPGRQNITTQAGDAATFVSDGNGNWTCLAYQRSDGTPLFGNYLQPGNNLSDVTNKVLARLNIGAAALEDVYSIAIAAAMGLGLALGTPNGQFDPFSTQNNIDLTKSSGFFQDTSAGVVNAGQGAQAYVIENASSLPKMTSNTATATGATGYVASASSTYVSGGEYTAFSGQAVGSSTYWEASSGSLPQWLCLKVPTAIKLAGYALNGYSSNGNYSPSAWQLQGTNDATAATNPGGASWTTLDTQTGQSITATRNVYTIPSANQGSYQYHRILITAVVGTSSYNALLTIFELLQYTPAFETDTSLPIMTSNTAVVGGASGYTAFSNLTAAQIYSGRDAWQLFDKKPTINDSNATDSSSSFDTYNNPVLPCFAGRGFPAAVKIGGYTIAGYNDGTNYFVPGSFQIQGSNDPTVATNPSAANWTTLDTRTGIIQTTGRVTFSIPAANQGYYLYYRIYVTAVNGSQSNRLILPALDLLQVLIGIESQTSIPYMTGANTVVGGASGYAVSSNSSAGTGYEPFRACDGIRLATTGANLYWQTNVVPSQWVRQLPAAIKVVAYRMASIAAYSNTAWQLQGSNDGVNWTTVDSRTVGANFWSTNYGDWQYFSVATPGSYSYYRLNCTGAGSDGYVRLAEVEFLQGTTGVSTVQMKPYANPKGVPTKMALITAVRQNAGTVNVNTNILGYVSRDGGNTFTLVTLTAIGTLNGFVLYQSAYVDVTATPSGSSFVGKVVSNDNTVGYSLDYIGVLGVAA